MSKTIMPPLLESAGYYPTQRPLPSGQEYTLQENVNKHNYPQY